MARGRQLGSAVGGDIGEVDRNRKSQFEFPYCLDSIFKVIIFWPVSNIRLVF